MEDQIHQDMLKQTTLATEMTTQGGVTCSFCGCSEPENVGPFIAICEMCVRAIAFHLCAGTSVCVVPDREK